MEVIDGGIVFSGQMGIDKQSCTFPGICILQDGRWLSTFRAAPLKTPLKGQHVLITWSDDEGKTWSDPISPFSPPLVDGKSGLFRCAYLTSINEEKVMAVICWVDNSSPELPFFNEETEGLLNTRIFLSWSENRGETWSKPNLVDTTKFNVPVPITGPALILPNGEIACQFELNKHYYDKTDWSHSSVLAFSKDEGQTWYRHCIASNDPGNRYFYWDQRPSVMSDGRILDLFWTFDKVQSTYLNIHARESEDNGMSWSGIWDTGVPGQPASPISLPDDKIAMIYIDRTDIPTIKMRISEDGGRTWPNSTEAAIFKANLETQTADKKGMQDAWSEMAKFSVGLPSTTVMQDNDILTVYYAGPCTDLTDIRWIRIRI